MNAAVIVAAGMGVRMGAGIRKQYLPLQGRPVLCRTLQVFADWRKLDRLVVVLPEEHLDEFRNTLLPLVRFRAGQAVVLTVGGKTRQASVYQGLQQFETHAEGIVLVHDGVRPLVSTGLIEACADGARQFGACIPAINVQDTLKRVTEDGRIAETIPRKGVWLAQTPQAFQLPLILAAHSAACLYGWEATDDASLVERYGAPVKIVAGSQANIKITTPEDIALAEFYFSSAIRP